jgi:sorbitol-specific phosphotransferase system component IIBC
MYGANRPELTLQIRAFIPGHPLDQHEKQQRYLSGTLKIDICITNRMTSEQTSEIDKQSCSPQIRGYQSPRMET